MSEFPSFSKAEQYCTACIYCILYIHSPVDGHLGCFNFLAIVNNVAMNVGVQIFVHVPAIILLSIYPKMEFLDHVVILYLIF